MDETTLDVTTRLITCVDAPARIVDEFAKTCPSCVFMGSAKAAMIAVNYIEDPEVLSDELRRLVRMTRAQHTPWLMIIKKE